MGNILHILNKSVSMFHIFLIFVYINVSVTQPTEMDYAVLIQSLSALENRQASTETDIHQLNGYVSSVGRLITRYAEMESKLDTVLEFKGYMRAMKQELENEMELIKQDVIVVKRVQDERSGNCQGSELVEQIQEVTQELSDTLQLKQSFEEMKTDMQSLKWNVSIMSERVNGTLLDTRRVSESIREFKEVAEIRMNNIETSHADDNRQLTQTLSGGLNQYQRYLNQLESKCQQNYSAIQQIQANIRVDVSRFDHNLSAGLNNMERINNQVTSLRDRVMNYSQEKCQSGIFGFHRYPNQPVWPKTTAITFSPPFSLTPSVTHGIYLLDVNKDINTRAVVEVTNVFKSGFTLGLKTFAGTKLYGFRVRWMACL